MSIYIYIKPISFNFQNGLNCQGGKKISLLLSVLRCLLDERMKTVFFPLLLLHSTLRTPLIGVHWLSIKSGRCHLTNDSSSKSSHAVGYNRYSQQADRATHGTALRPENQNKPAGRLTVDSVNFLEERFNLSFLFTAQFFAAWDVTCQRRVCAQASHTFRFISGVAHISQEESPLLEGFIISFFLGLCYMTF